MCLLYFLMKPIMTLKKNNLLCLDPILKMNIKLLPTQHLRSFGFNLLFELHFPSIIAPKFGVTMLVTYLATNLVFHACIRHVEIDFTLFRNMWRISNCLSPIFHTWWYLYQTISLAYCQSPLLSPFVGFVGYNVSNMQSSS